MIASVAVPAFGVSDVTPLTFSASATDEDDDVITYAWSFAGRTFSTQSLTTTLGGDGDVPVTLTASDTKGAQTSTTRTLTLGTLTGQWNLLLNNGNYCGPFGTLRPPVMTFNQNGRQFTGTLASPSGWCNVPGGTTGALDPASPGSVDADGNVTMRLKLGQYIDTFLTGRFSESGREVTGRSAFQDSTFVSVFTLRKL